MKTIRKYKILPNCELMLNRGARLLTCQIQKDDVYLWALLDTDELLIKYKFYTIGTGHDATIVLDRLYLGTVQFSKIDLVFHVFYEVL